MYICFFSEAACRPASGSLIAEMFEPSSRGVANGKNKLDSHLIYRHLLVDREFVVVSHLKIFPLQLLGPAEKPMAGPSSCKGKILR